MAFKYRRSSPFPLLLGIAEREMDTIEDFFDRAKEAWRAGQQDIEQMAARSSGENVPDGDRWVDDVAQLKEFSWLYSEFAIIGLWRCIELYEGRAKRHIRRHKQSAMRSALDIILRDKEKKIRCARSVDELRCLNNAIKHERRVNGELAEFPRWKKKKGNKNSKLVNFPRWKTKKNDELGDLERHYLRLRPCAKRYLEDLTKRLNNAKISSLSPAGQVSKT